MLYNKISGFSDEIASDIIEQLEGLNKLGIKYFEPRGICGKNISELSENEATELKKVMDKYGIKASSIGSPIGKIKLTDDFTAHFEVFKNVVRTAKILGTNYIRMFSFYHDGGEWTPDERADVLNKLKTMIDYAKGNGVILLHENEKDIYGDTAERCADIMHELGCENFRCVFDPANFVQSGEDTVNAYNLLKPHIEYMHIKDAKREDGSVVPAGFGDGNVRFILTSIMNDGYNGFLSLEPHLASFEGLRKLELDDKMSKLPKGGLGTFTLAYNSLMDIIESI